MEILTLSTSECDYVLRQDLKRDNQVKMSLLGWALIQDVCVFIRRNQDTRTHKDHMKTQTDDSHLQVKERGLKRNPLTPCSWTFRFQNYKKINFCCLSHPVWVLCYGSPCKLMYHLLFIFSQSSPICEFLSHFLPLNHILLCYQLPTDTSEVCW